MKLSLLPGFRLRSGYLLSYALVTAISCASSSKDDLTRDRIVAETVFVTLQNQHFAPQEINDAFSKKAFDAYLKNLDANKRFLLQEDVDQLKAQESTIDDDLRDGNFRLMRLAEMLLAKRTQQINGFYEELLAKPFDFNADESIEFDYDKRRFAKNMPELREEWRRYEKYQTLIQLVSKLQAGRKNKVTADSVRILLTPDMEKAARESVRKSNKDFFKRLSQINESDRLSEFINAVTHLYDPHTDYYAPANKDNFDIQLSGKLEGIGATLNLKDGFITVANVVAGSAAWRQGQLKANDQILKVAQDKDDPVDVSDMRIDDAIKLIRGKKGTRVVLTVRKPDASIIEIPIVRDVVILEDTFVKSTLIKPESGRGFVGYINLPSFYVDFNRSGGRRCSDDVRDEIKKLKEAGAKSIIFDLRNNGGGSLPDVVRIAGFFVDKGPIVQVKSRNNGISVMDDRDAGEVFDGPLVVMVNPFSASASEIFAAAIQDYKRGIIFGSPHTFGKGTVQQIIDLDQVVPYQYSQFKPLGSVKLTTQKFYRIDGGATQLRGVSSDVVAPDVYKYIKYGEKELENMLPWDQIAPAKYTPLSSNVSAMEKAIAASRTRIAKSDYFAGADKGALRLKARQDEQNFTLNIYKYIKEIQEGDVEDKKMRELTNALPKLSIQPYADDNATPSDTLATARRKKFNEDVTKDAYIMEATRICQDL